MATSLQARIAARGFPVFDSSGQSGQGALPDSTLPSAQVPPGSPTASWTDPNVDVASVAATMPAPEEYVLGQMAWGLPAEPKPDDTPRTHAAPIADPTLAWQDGARKNSEGIGEYNAELLAAHDPGFNGWEIRHHPGTRGRFGFDQERSQGSPAGPLQPVSGQIRSNAGYDGVQGYGGWAGGPDKALRGEGGTNATMPLTVNNIDFPGNTFHNVYLNAAEVPFLVPSADQFIAYAPELPAFTGVYDAPNATVSAQDVTVADSPAQGAPVAAAGGLLPLWGSY